MDYRVTCRLRSGSEYLPTRPARVDAIPSRPSGAFTRLPRGLRRVVDGCASTSADVKRLRGVEVKSGEQYATQENLWEITRDEILMKEQGWAIEWRFEGTASKPLKKALTDAGIPFTGG